MPGRSLEGGTQQALRRSNQRLLIERLLAEEGSIAGLTRPELARDLELTPQAIANLVEDGLGWLKGTNGTAREGGRGGRPAELLRVPGDVGWVIGIELDKDGIRVALADLHGRIVECTEFIRMDVEHDFHAALQKAAQAGQDLANDRDVQANAVAGIGVAIAAPTYVTSDGGKAELRLNLGAPPPAEADWRSQDPVEALNSHLRTLPEGDLWSRIPTHFGNDANLAALAELCVGKAKGKRDVIVLQWARGLGAGLIVGGSLCSGAGGVAGELGHVPVDIDDAHRSACERCGRYCLESTIRKLLAGDGAASSTENDLDRTIQAAERGDAQAAQAVETAARLVGRVLATAIDLLNPEQILLNGHFGPEAYLRLVPPIQAELNAFAVTPAATDVVVGLGDLGDRAVIHGAIWLALNRERTNYLLAYVKL